MKRFQVTIREYNYDPETGKPLYGESYSKIIDEEDGQEIFNLLKEKQRFKEKYKNFS